jgi:hypothetical protein
MLLVYAAFLRQAASMQQTLLHQSAQLLLLLLLPTLPADHTQHNTHPEES